MTPIFFGSMVALITPFSKGEIDEKTLRNSIQWHLKSGTDGLVPCGTTGEAPTLSDEEQARIVAIAVEEVDGKIPILAGAGSNSTEKAIKLTKQAKKAGALGTLQVTPYYNKPTQEGLYQHFKAIALAVDLPMVLYNVPGRTGVNLEPKTVKRLSQIDTIVGIKEASGNLDQIQKILDETDADFHVYSGDDSFNAQIYALGGQGTISVTANVVPDRVAKVWDFFANGKKGEAFLAQENLQPLNKILFIETNPIPVKTALSLMGKCREEFRLPLCPINDANRETLKKILKEEKLIP